jgi:hypothetical protein
VRGWRQGPNPAAADAIKRAACGQFDVTRIAQRSSDPAGIGIFE